MKNWAADGNTIYDSGATGTNTDTRGIEANTYDENDGTDYGRAGGDSLSEYTADFYFEVTFSSAHVIKQLKVIQYASGSGQAPTAGEWDWALKYYDGEWKTHASDSGLSGNDGTIALPATKDYTGLNLTNVTKVRWESTSSATGPEVPKGCSSGIFELYVYGSLDFSINESITITEDINCEVSGLSISDSPSIAENISFHFSHWNFSLSDIVSIDESVSLSLSHWNLSISDSISISEDTALLLHILNVSVNDSISINESISNLLSHWNILLSDSISIVEDNSFLISHWNISLSNSISIVEDNSFLISHWNISISDSISISEYISFSLSAILSDDISIDESISFLFSHWNLSLYNTISITESITPLLSHWNLSLIESISISDVEEDLIVNKFARAGGGNWNTDATWSTTTGGAADTTKPDATDDVFLDANSGNVTIAANSYCRSINCTDYTGTLTQDASTTLYIGDATAGAGNIALKLDFIAELNIQAKIDLKEI